MDQTTTNSSSDAHVTLDGTKFWCVTEDETRNLILDSWARGEGGWVSTPNTHQLSAFRKDPKLRALATSASLVVADGKPLIWASRLQRTPLPERVAGSSLVWSLAESARDRGASLFLLGGREGVARRAAAALRDRLPGINIAGTYCPPFGFERDPSQLATIRDRLRAAQPALVYVGLGFPKQEQLIVDLAPGFPATWFLGIGISLSFISGDVSRAPDWIQDLGLEWAFRLSQEPARLFRRYLVDGIPYTTRLLLVAAIRGQLNRLARGEPTEAS